VSNSFDIGSQLKQFAQLQQDGGLNQEEYNKAKAILLDHKHPQQRTLLDELYALVDLYDADDLTDEEFEQAKASLLGIERNVKLKHAPKQQRYVKSRSEANRAPAKAVKEKSNLYTYIRDLPNEQAKNKKLAADLERIEDADEYELEELEHKYKMQIYKMGFALLFLTPASLYLGIRVISSVVNLNLTAAYAEALGNLFIMVLAAIPAMGAFGKLIESEYLLRVVRARQGNDFSIRWIYQFSGYLGFSVLLCGFCACSSTAWAGLRARDYVPSTPRVIQTQVVASQKTAVPSATPRPVQPTEDNWMQATFKPADVTATPVSTQPTAPERYIVQNNGVTWIIDRLTTHSKADDWTPLKDMTYLVITGTFENTTQGDVEIVSSQFTLMIDERKYTPHTGIMQRIQNENKLDYVGSYSGITIEPGKTKRAFLAFEVPLKRESMSVFFEGKSVHEMGTSTPTYTPSATYTPGPTNTPRPTNTMRPTAASAQTTIEGVNARSCPSISCKVVKVVSSRDSFKLIGTYDDWYSVEFNDGTRAYIRGDFIVVPDGAVVPVGPRLTSTPRPTNMPKPINTPRPVSPQATPANSGVQTTGGNTGGDSSSGGNSTSYDGPEGLPSFNCPSNCTQAREMGLSSEQAAQCGLDRDGDGQACYGDQ